MGKYLFLGMFILGLIASFIYLKFILHGFFVKKNFIPTQAKILNYQITEKLMQNPNMPVSNPKKIYKLTLQYDYEFLGSKFQSHQLNKFNNVHADKTEALEQLIPNADENGERILTVYVNPKNPSEAFALPMSWNKWTYGVISFLLVSFTIFFGLLTLIN